MYLTTIVLCAINIVMPVMAAAIVAQRLQENSALKMGLYGGVICAVTSTVLYVNIGIMGYPDWKMSTANIAMIFIFSSFIGFTIGFTAMRLLKNKLTKQV